MSKQNDAKNSLLNGNVFKTMLSLSVPVTEKSFTPAF